MGNSVHIEGYSIACCGVVEYRQPGQRGSMQGSTVQNNTSIINMNANCFYLRPGSPFHGKKPLQACKHAVFALHAMPSPDPVFQRKLHQIACKVRLFARQLNEMIMILIKKRARMQFKTQSSKS